MPVTITLDPEEVRRGRLFGAWLGEFYRIEGRLALLEATLTNLQDSNPPLADGYDEILTGCLATVADTQRATQTLHAAIEDADLTWGRVDVQV